ncbi:MAG TPA: hypothetical protein PKV43_14400 [Armatimonadota bacterium]|nr:hypothetical protein [Armatimonadota bacterium]
MNLELLKTVAMLCAISGSGDSALKTEIRQVECQSYYVVCIEKSKKTISQCVEGRGIIFEGAKEFAQKAMGGK